MDAFKHLVLLCHELRNARGRSILVHVESALKTENNQLPQGVRRICDTVVLLLCPVNNFADNGP
jgi:hypothetical protein